MPYKNIESVKKFWSKVIKRSSSECWQWIGNVNNGFGRFNTIGVSCKAHIFSWEIHNNKRFPSRHHISFKCNNKLCVNPEHLIFMDTNQKFWSKVNKRSKNECWNWQGAVSTSGYGNFNHNKYDRAHRFSWELHNDKKIPKGLHVLHKCDNKLCVNPHHLFIGTNKDNMADKVKKGRSLRGENHPCSIFTKEQVLEIRKKFKPRIYTAKQLAMEYNVPYTAISSILTNASWKWLK